MLLRQQVDAYKQAHFWFTIKFQLALLDSSLVGLYCSMRPVTILFFFGSLNQFQNVVIKRILNCCIQISHNNFEYLLDMQFQISFSLIFLQKMFRLCPLCSGSIRVRSNSLFEHSHLPIGACVRVIDEWLNKHSSKVRFFQLLKNDSTTTVAAPNYCKNQ